MGNLFPDSEEYPDYRPMPRITLVPEYRSIKAPVAGLAIAGTFLGFCPAVHEEHQHVPHQEHATDLNTIRAVAVSSTSANTIVPGTGSLRFTGYAPKVVIG